MRDKDEENIEYNFVLILQCGDGNSVYYYTRIIQNEEAKAAESFGFPEFLPVEETGLALTEEETNDRETFGYWCRDCRLGI